jgi:hypothetical protein
MDHNAISFANVPSDKKRALLERCLSALMDLNLSRDTVAKLFWSIDPSDELLLSVLANFLDEADQEQISRTRDLYIPTPKRLDRIYRELCSVEAASPQNARLRAILQSWSDLANEERVGREE